MLKMVVLMKTETIEKEILKALLGTLKDVPFLTARGGKITTAPRKGIRPDAVIEADLGKNKKRKLFVEVRSIGQPRLIREAINQLLRFIIKQPDSYGIVGAPYISPAAAEICKEDGIGYLDLAGNCRLVFDTVYIVREGAKNPFAQRRDLRSLYSPRGTRILRVMLNNPRIDWKTQALADRAKVSVGQVANIKKLLKDKEWTIESNDGFRLKKPADLLAEWSENYSFRKNEVRDFYSMASIASVEQIISKACAERDIQFGLTGLSGSARLQPGIRYQRTMAFLSDIPGDFIETVGLKDVASGANVSLMIPYDIGVFAELHNYDFIPVVSPVQIYLDLKSFKGRGEEAAQIIFDKVLAPSW